MISSWQIIAFAGWVILVELCFIWRAWYNQKHPHRRVVVPYDNERR
jgi:hypothetical protein